MLTSTTCSQCPAGWYQDLPKQLFCKACPAGYHARREESRECAACPAGKIAKYNESEQCNSCITGRISAGPAGTVCEKCAVGQSTQGKSEQSTCHDLRRRTTEKPYNDGPPEVQMLFINRSDVNLSTARDVYTKEYIDPAPINSFYLTFTVCTVIDGGNKSYGDDGKKINVSEVRVEWSPDNKFPMECDPENIKICSKAADIFNAPSNTGTFAGPDIPSSKGGVIHSQVLLGRNTLFQKTFEVNVRISCYFTDTSWSSGFVLPSVPHRVLHPSPKRVPRIQTFKLGKKNPSFVPDKNFYLSLNETYPFLYIIRVSVDIDHGQSLDEMLYAEILWSTSPHFESDVHVSYREFVLKPTFEGIIHLPVARFGSRSRKTSWYGQRFYIKPVVYYKNADVVEGETESMPRPSVFRNNEEAPQFINSILRPPNTLTLIVQGPSAKNVDYNDNILFLLVELSQQRSFEEITPVWADDGGGLGLRLMKQVRIDGKQSVNNKFAFNITFLHRVYEISYFIRLTAVMEDSTHVQQTELVNPWGSSAADCDFISEYLQTHRSNNENEPFSSAGDLNCRPCPDGASCSGGWVTFSDIVARAGFHRMSWNSTLFGICPTPEACEGVLDKSNSKGEYLSPGVLIRESDQRYDGPNNSRAVTSKDLERCRYGHDQSAELCSVCKKGYYVSLTSTIKGVCTKCPKQERNLPIFIFLILVTVYYMYYLVSDSLNGSAIIIKGGLNSTGMPYHTIALRILQSYLQVASLLTYFRVNLSNEVATLVEYQGKAASVVAQVLSFDCSASQERGLGLFFLKQTVAVCLPLATPLVAIVWLLVHKTKKGGVKFLWDKILRLS